MLSFVQNGGKQHPLQISSAYLVKAQVEIEILNCSLKGGIIV